MAFTSLRLLAAATATAALTASAAMAQSTMAPAPAAPSNAMPMSGNPVPPQGWTLPEPSTGWSGVPSAVPLSRQSDRSRTAHNDSAGLGTAVGLPSNFATTDHAFTATSPARDQMTRAVPGIDTHATVEQTSLGITIVRGPAGQ